MNNLTLGSLFDGSGGFPLGAMLNGIIPVWASEIEPFPIRVTTKRLPFMKHLGDICTINGAKIKPVDIITFGSPCTDMSVAGKRAGLDGKQSVLFYEAIRIIKEMRRATDGQYPRYIVFENVPGAFSSNKGEDFKAVLEAIIGIIEPETEVPSPNNGMWPYADVYVGDGWSLAYRTIDAQYFGVAQRRRRIYLVADFRSERAGEILFEREGVSRDFTPRFIQGQGTASNAEKGTGTPMCFEPGAASRLGGYWWIDSTCTLRADMGDNQLAIDDEYLSSLANVFKRTADEEGFGEWDTIHLIISFVQHLDYVSDDIGTGYDEYPKFPLETLYDKGGDCEDSSILLASLLREMGYGVVLIAFDTHMGVGIKGGSDLPGYYFTGYGINYYYIETTSTGWEVGDMPDECIGKSASILYLN